MARTVYLTDNGDTAGDSINWEGSAAITPAGSDVMKTTPDVMLVGTEGQVRRVSSLTGTPAVADYGGTFPTGAEPNAIYIPYYDFGTTTANSSTTPEYLAASDTLTAGNAALWKVTASGATFTDITPNDGSAYGVAVSNQCIAVGWFDSDIIVALMDFGGTRKIAYSSNGGSSYTFTAALNAAADSLELGRLDGRVTFSNGATYGVIVDISASLTVLSKTSLSTGTGQSTNV
jgi:hypothetical protein